MGLGVAAATLVLVGIIVAEAWSAFGDADMTAAGWGALVIGIVLTVALGVGLMSLVFISHRRGYDDRGRHRR
jgi:hypothetical protein